MIAFAPYRARIQCEWVSKPLYIWQCESKSCKSEDDGKAHCFNIPKKVDVENRDSRMVLLNTHHFPSHSRELKLPFLGARAVQDLRG